MLGEVVVGSALTHVLDDRVNLSRYHFRYICRISMKSEYGLTFRTTIGTLACCRRLRIHAESQDVPRAKGPLKAYNYVSED